MPHRITKGKGKGPKKLRTCNSFVFEQPSSCSNSSTEDLREAILTEMSYDTPRVEILNVFVVAKLCSFYYVHVTVLATIMPLPFSQCLVAIFPALRYFQPNFIFTNR